MATQTPTPSPAGPAPQPPANGLVFCYGTTGSALCNAATGTTVRPLPVNAVDVSTDTADGYVYYRQVGSDAHGSVEQIDRTPIAGGATQVLVQGPSMLNATAVSFGSPIVSPDGQYLAYGQLTITERIPGASYTALGSPVGPGGIGGSRFVQIKVQRLTDLSAAPLVVPASFAGTDASAGPLLGWSADGISCFSRTSNTSCRHSRSATTGRRPQCRPSSIRQPLRPAA